MSHDTSSVSEAEINFVVIRANGTQEDLGTFYYARNPIKKMLYKIRGWKN